MNDQNLTDKEIAVIARMIVWGHEKMPRTLTRSKEPLRSILYDISLEGDDPPTERVIQEYITKFPQHKQDILDFVAELYADGGDQ